MERPPLEKLQALTANSDHNLAAVFDYCRYLEKENRGWRHQLSRYVAALEGRHHRLTTDPPATPRTVTVTGNPQ